MKNIITSFALIGCLTAAHAGEKPASHGVPVGPTSPRARAQDAPPAAPTAEELSLAAANNRFAFMLFGEVAKGKKGENVVISPLSAFIALGMLYNAAGGDTKKEILKALGANDLTEADLNKAVEAFTKNLKAGNGSKVEVANAILLDKTMPTDPAFVDRITKAYTAVVKNLTGNDAQDLEEINKFVKEKAGIEPFMDKLPPNTKLVLMNATRFTGTWETKFDPPKPGTFAGLKDVPIMTAKINGKKTGTRDGKEWQGVELPYGADKGASMTILLPPVDGDPAVTRETWLKLRKQLKEEKDEEGTVYMPPFSSATETDLTPPLKTLGVVTAFEEGKANFTGVTSRKGLYVTAAKQTAFIEVDDKGTKAGAATAVIAGSKGVTSSGFTMDVNRPFFYAVTDNRTGAILFMGTVNDPKKK